MMFSCLEFVALYGLELLWWFWFTFCGLFVLVVLWILLDNIACSLRLCVWVVLLV